MLLDLFEEGLKGLLVETLLENVKPLFFLLSAQFRTMLTYGLVAIPPLVSHLHSVHLTVHASLASLTIWIVNSW